MKNLRKQRHAAQRNTKPARGRAVSLTQIITTNPPPKENLIRYEANPKNPMPRSFACGAITKLSHHVGSLKNDDPYFARAADTESAPSPAART